jgi:peroxiredoxin
MAAENRWFFIKLAFLSKLFMKQILIALVLLVSIDAVAQKTTFSITGTLNNITDPIKKVILSYRSNGQRKVDSVEVKNGQYSFTGSVTEPTRASLQAKYAPAADGKPKMLNGRRDVASFFIEPSKIKVTSTDSFSNVKISGSAAQKAYDGLEASLKPANEKMSAFMKKYSAATSEEKKTLEPEYEVIDKEIKQVYKEYAVKNRKSPVALYAITQYAGYDINAAEVEPLFNALPAATKARPSAVEFADRLAIAKKLVIGQPAMDFTQTDTAGNPVALSSLRGKVLLVDFWASWCGPCRRDNPNVVRVFNQYKDKGFDVLGVSLDQPGAKEKWIKAIHDDKLTWTHVSDLKFWDNDVAKLYGVRAIPFNLLLDKNGNIIGRNLHGEELEKKLTEVFQ